MNKIWILVGIVFAAAMSRVLPHPANFTPVAAMALVAGTYFVDKRMALLVPTLSLLTSDCIIGFYPGMIFTYIAMIGVTILGMGLNNKSSLLRIAGFTFSGSTLFFIVSNFGVWLAGDLYPQSWTGLVDCYIKAIPFYGNTLAGDFTYVGVIFGTYYFLRQANSFFFNSSVSA